MTAVPASTEHARLGGYRLLERIGGGPTSGVYAAEDQATGQRVAVKMIVADLADEPETRARFNREVRVTAALVHRNIVRVLHVGEDQEHPYLVMELLDGQPLGPFLQGGGAVTIASKRDLIAQLCCGLQAAHEGGVVHRDIKPSNLFVQVNGCLTILDFGLARLQASTLTARHQILGTPEFMSPEQATGDQVDTRSDIFSAAAVGYFIVAGRAPFARPDLRQTLLALLHDNPAPIPEVKGPPALVRVLTKGLAKTPADRYRSCADMLIALNEVSL